MQLLLSLTAMPQKGVEGVEKMVFIRDLWRKMRNWQAGYNLCRMNLEG